MKPTISNFFYTLDIHQLHVDRTDISSTTVQEIDTCICIATDLYLAPRCAANVTDAVATRTQSSRHTATS